MVWRPPKEHEIDLTPTGLLSVEKEPEEKTNLSQLSNVPPIMPPTFQPPPEQSVPIQEIPLTPQGIDEPAQFVVDNKTQTVRGLDPTKEVDYMGLWKSTRLPSEALRNTLQKVIDVIPDPKSKSAFINFVLMSPKAAAEIVSDVGSQYATPEAIGLFGMGKMLPMVAKTPIVQTGIKKVGAMVPDQLKKFLFYRFKQPQQYVDVALKRIQNIKEGLSDVLKIGKGMSKLSDTERVMAAQYMKGEIGPSTLSQNVLDVADDAKNEFIKLGKESVDLGLLPEEVYQKNVGTYLPRLYKTKEEITSGGISYPKKPIREDLSRFKARKDIPEDIRASMGEIIEAGYPTTKGLSQLRNTVETHKLFKNVSENPEWSTVSEELGKKLGFVKMAEVKSLGPLSGKYVHPYIADDLNQIVSQKSGFEKVWGSMMGKWKYGKVVLNPSTHFRNMFSNSILSDMGGMGFVQQARILPKAAKEIWTKGPLYQELKNEGVIGSEFVGGEIKDLMTSFAGQKGPLLEKISKYSSTIGNKLLKFRDNTKGASDFLGKLYQSEEQVFKLGKYIRNRELGMTVKEAAKDAEKWLFNYEKVSPFIDKVRQSPLGSPFITFTSKAFPRVMETAMTNPLKLYKYKLLFDAIENKAQKELNLSDADMDVINKKSRGDVLILPFRDKDGNVMTMDLSYILPWSDLPKGIVPGTDIGEQGGMEIAGLKLPPISPPSGPLKSLMELGFNHNTFTDKPIYLDTDLPHEKIQKSIDHIGRTLLPSLTPGGIEEDSALKGGYSFNKIVKAIQKRPDYFGRVRGLPLVLADTILGIKINPVDINMINAFDALKMQQEIREVQVDMQRKFRNQSINEDYKLKLPDLMNERIQRIIKKHERPNP